MEKFEIIKCHQEFTQRINDLIDVLKPDEIIKQIALYEEEMSQGNFWDDNKYAAKVLQECNSLKEKLTTLKEIQILNDDIGTILELNDESLFIGIEDIINTLSEKLEKFEVSLLLNGEYDSLNAIMEIHPGAGGTESCDWASMLKRMYIRWCEKQNYKYEILEELPGEEAGIKSFSMLIHGMYAYGYLKNERGVHRLIRISPFDSGGRRHTSFAAILVTPYREENIEIEIKESDIRVDIYRSSGCGGQGVNTTDSAVRITHLPSKIVVTCQNERSQIQNKAKALEVLKNKLYQLEIEKQNEMRNEARDNESAINFGSQIRTYTMCPYTLVKDHRTNVEVGNVNKVLDGDLDVFINASLKGGNK